MVDVLFSSGVGPALEKNFPYHGKNSLTDYQYLKQNKQEAIEEIKNDNKGISDKDAELFYKDKLSGYKDADQYSADDDWSIPDNKRRVSAGYVLVDSNCLPVTYLVNSTEEEPAGFSQSAVDAIKKEIDKGRGIAVSYCSDDSLPGEKSDDPLFITKDTYAHYTYNPAAASNHTVCIVGYDDNYPKENFLQGTSAAGYSKTPPENGAWIAKNSWGSETDFVINKDGRPIGKSDWGVRDKDGKATGYFYLSYYDKSVNSFFSFNFSNKIEAESFSQYQYDYMTSLENAYYEDSEDELKIANIYAADEDEIVTSIGIRAYRNKTTSTVKVFKLNDEYNSPEDGELVSETSAYYDYAGYHRIPLDTKVRLYPGETFSVVVENETDAGYVFSANRAPSKKAAVENGHDYYGVAIVHPGESFLYKDSTWMDWVDYQKTNYFARHMKEVEGTFFGGIPDYSVDNFTAKAFALPADKSDAQDPAETESDKKSSKKSDQKKKTDKGTDPNSSGEEDFAKETTNFVSISKGSTTPKTGDAPLLGLTLSTIGASIVCFIAYRRKITE